jgi:hypothetical protein
MVILSERWRMLKRPWLYWMNAAARDQSFPSVTTLSATEFWQRLDRGSVPVLCYRVLAAAGQGECARAALQSAYELVMARADKITDPDLRQSFLERGGDNRQIVQEYRGVERER